MKSSKFIFIILLIATFLLAGCNKVHMGTYDASKENGGAEPTVAPTVNRNVTEENGDNTGSAADLTKAPDSAASVTAEDVTPTADAIKPVANTEIQVYTVNVDTGDIKPIPALVPSGSDITAELIVDTVKESLADQSINVGVESVVSDGDTVIVSFMKDTPPVTGTGSGFEAAILDAFAQSLVDNLGVKVVYRIEGNAYASGVFEFGIDEVYPLGDN